MNKELGVINSFYITNHYLICGHYNQRNEITTNVTAMRLGDNLNVTWNVYFESTMNLDQDQAMISEMRYNNYFISNIVGQQQLLMIIANDISIHTKSSFLTSGCLYRQEILFQVYNPTDERVYIVTNCKDYESLLSQRVIIMNRRMVENTTISVYSFDTYEISQNFIQLTSMSLTKFFGQMAWIGHRNLLSKDFLMIQTPYMNLRSSQFIKNEASFELEETILFPLKYINFTKFDPEEHKMFNTKRKIREFQSLNFKFSHEGKHPECSINTETTKIKHFKSEG